MAIPDFNLDEIIARSGCSGADNIEQCLLDACDREMDRPDDESQDIELAFNCVRAVIRRLDGNEAPRVQKYLAGALFRRAQILALLGRDSDARRDFQGIAYTWRDSTDPDVRRIAAGNFLEAGRFEEELGNTSEAEKYYEEAGRYIGDPDPITQRQVADAFCNHADIYIARRQLDPAGEKIALIRDRWLDSPEYWIRRRIAGLLVNYADGIKLDDERRAEALPLFDEAIAYADRAIDPPVYFIQASARMSKCNCYERLERYEEAVAAVDTFESWMSGIAGSSAGGQGQIYALAEHSLHLAYLVKARCLNELGHHADALEAFRRSTISIADLSEDPDRRHSACRDLLRLVKILSDLGRHDEARKLYDEIVERMFEFGKDSIEQTTLACMNTMFTYLERGSAYFEKHRAGGPPGPS